MLKRWPAFTRFLDDGRVCLSNNAAEHGLRGIALGRKPWMFAGKRCSRSTVSRCCAPPLLLIGGSAEAHTTPDELQQLYDRANEPEVLWMIRKRPLATATVPAWRRASD